MVLCNNPSYHTGFCFHEELRAEDMHVVVRCFPDGLYSPVSWCGRPRLVEDKFCWDMKDARVPGAMFVMSVDVFIKL